MGRPHVSHLAALCVVLIRCRHSAIMTRMFEGLAKGYQGSLVPVLSTELSLFDAVRKLDHLQGSVLPTSSRKISHCKVTLPAAHVAGCVGWLLASSACLQRFSLCMSASST